LPRKLPVLNQFLLVKVCPPKHDPQGSWREFAVNGARFQLDQDFVLAVNCVKVRDSMLAAEHSDHGAEESSSAIGGLSWNGGRPHYRLYFGFLLQNLFGFDENIHRRISEEVDLV